MPLTKYKAACVTSEPCWFDLKASVQKTINFISEAGETGCKLVAFSETWIPGYPYWIWNVNYQQSLPMVKKLRENSLAIDSEEFRRIRRAARDNQIYVSLGFSEIDQATLYMTQTLIDSKGEIINHRRKIKPTAMEKVVFGDADGDTFKSVTQTELGRLGQLNCYENTNPFLKSLNVSEGEQIHVAAFPAGPASPFSDSVDFIAPSYALTTATWVLAPFQRLSVEGLKKNTPEGVEPDTDPSIYNGFARIHKPDGTLAIRADKDFDGLLIADIDLNECHLPKALADFGGHYMRPDLIRLLVDTRRKELVTEADSSNCGIATYSTRERLGLNVPLDTQGPKQKTNAAHAPASSTP